VEAFRQQLISGWSRDEDDSPSASQGSKTEESKSYRLSSMFASSRPISSGPDMADDVVRSLAANVRPADDESTIIILCARGRDEMVGVRHLVASYGDHKSIVLVNCCLDPLPRELLRAQTVYSVQPLIARPRASASEHNIFGSARRPPSADDAAARTKVVVMRRFPRDWEIFVDAGSGFEIAASASPDQVDRRGPSSQFIAAAVKKFLQTRLGK
jgi:hypothetical protein